MEKKMKIVQVATVELENLPLKSELENTKILPLKSGPCWNNRNPSKEFQNQSRISKEQKIPESPVAPS
jgi:hypothetical protein